MSAAINNAPARPLDAVQTQAVRVYQAAHRANREAFRELDRAVRDSVPALLAAARRRVQETSSIKRQALQDLEDALDQEG